MKKDTCFRSSPNPWKTALLFFMKLSKDTEPKVSVPEISRHYLKRWKENRKEEEIFNKPLQKNYFICQKRWTGICTYQSIFILPYEKKPAPPQLRITFWHYFSPVECC